MKFKVPSEPNDGADANPIDSLDSVFMGSYEVSKNEWSFLADLIYLKMSGDTQGLNPNVNLKLELTAKLGVFNRQGRAPLPVGDTYLLLEVP